MYKPRKRRNDIIVRVLTYIIMTVAVAVLALLCLFIVLGYSIDKKTGQAEQGGLIQYRSFPDGASIFLDGQKQNFNTPGKTTADATEHSVNIMKDDYRNWNKNFTLNRGELLWLNARLVPSSITTNEVAQFESISQVIASPDKKWIAVLEKANDPLLKIIDIRDEKKPKIISLKIPVELSKSPAATFSVSEWDFGSRYLIVKSTSGAATEWLRLDRSDETNVKDITNLSKLSFSELHFTGNSGENFFGLENGNLRKLSLNQPLNSRLIASNVREFRLYGENKLALVTQKNNQEFVSVYRDGDKTPSLVETFPQASDLVHVALTSFFGDDYVAVSHNQKVKLIKNPFDDKPKTMTTLTVGAGMQWVYFSENGQFLITQTGLSIKGYNLERNHEIQFVIPGEGPYTRQDRLEWLDGFRFWSDIGGTLRMFEFDGTNAEVINSVSPGYDVTLSDNGKRLFSVGLNATTKKPVLQSSVMVIE